MTSALRPMVDAPMGGPFQHYLWYFGSQTTLVQLERPGVGRHAATAARRHLVQRLDQLRRAGAGAGAQLRHAALVVAGVRHARRSPTIRTALHGERVRRSLRSDGRRLPPHERLAEGLPGLVRRLQRRRGDQQRHVHAGAVRACRATARSSCRSRRRKARPFMRPAAGGGGATTENLDYYYLELRTPVDFDGTLGGSALSARVLVHIADGPAAAHAARAAHVLARHDADHDHASATPRWRSARRSPIRRAASDHRAGDQQLAARQSSSNYASGGSGDPTCMDGTAFTPPGPGRG